MSVVVKGMKMPKSCGTCFVGNRTICKNGCPLVELPEKHGDLIDRGAFKADYGMKDDCADCEKEMHGKVKACEYDRIYSKMDFCGWLDDAPPVIEAEDSE